MKKTLIAVFVLVILVGAIAAFLYWQSNPPKPAPVLVQAPPLPIETPKPALRKEIVAPPEQPPLPKLADSDSFMLAALEGLVGGKSLAKLFYPEKIIHDIVATIDNLPRRHAPMETMPFEPAPGKFLTVGREGDLTISPENAGRYKAYMKIVKAMDARKLVELYVRLYPLFQQSYEELGYPKKYFNDRLAAVLDDLLDAPDIKGPVRLVQPNVLYQYDDPDIEARSIGQRMLVRVGSKNEAEIKTWLREIKQELEHHMHEKKMGSAG